MKIQFPSQSTSDIINSLKKELSGRSLGDLVSLDSSGHDLIMKISKLGTSSLIFSRSENPGAVVFTLTSEKIAFAHKAFKDDVKQKLQQVIIKVGGTVLES